ncbi:MAG TPA: 4-hydroxythreonine-4-phosphate dehydrogenase PdxA, partial [Melioribacteraceae bacterium]|nr:4-hydroxythreonine-4-phosphate dehydrogenase PdxA [Melioribacteraceae bacterium]
LKLIKDKKVNKNRVILSIPENVFSYYADKINFNVEYDIIYKNLKSNNTKNKILINLLPSVKLEIGKPTKHSGQASIDSLNQSLDIIDMGLASGILTAPISKYAIKKAGVDFPGHTEIISNRYKISSPVMTFFSNKLMVALVTIHEPIKNVPSLITKEKLSSVIKTLKNSLKIDFGKTNLKIAILGLNPHAGENGKIGDEEVNIITRIIKKDRELFGPFVPDAYFGDKKFYDYDITLGMYHDQVLIPFKYIAFDKGVNYTAGLPIIRTSPDHGTAYDIAGSLTANYNSMLYAFNLLLKIIKNRKNVSK